MSGVLDGQPVSAAITNPAFIIKNANDNMPNILGFDRISGSGPAIADIQLAVNKLYTASGVSETQTGTVYNATAGTITNGQNYQSAFTVLADKFDASTGHMHTGTAGDGPLLPVVRSIAVTGFSPTNGNIFFIPGSGISMSQSGPDISISATGQTFIAVTGNPFISGNITFVAGPGISLVQAGQIITVGNTGGGGGSTMGPLLTPDASSGSFACPSGDSLFWPYLVVRVGDTITIASSAQFVGVTSVTVNGTFIMNGVGRIL